MQLEKRQSLVRTEQLQCALMLQLEQHGAQDLFGLDV
jgi:hypothetical protein